DAVEPPPVRGEVEAIGRLVGGHTSLRHKGRSALTCPLLPQWERARMSVWFELAPVSFASRQATRASRGERAVRNENGRSCTERPFDWREEGGKRSGGFLLRLSRVEEQGLTDRRLHRLGLEGLGDQESRLGPLAGQQPFRESGDEDHRHIEAVEDVLHRVDAGGTV